MEPKFDFNRYMHRKKWKQKDAYTALKVSKGLVGQWASGTARPSYEKIAKLVENGISAVELFGDQLGQMLVKNSVDSSFKISSQETLEKGVVDALVELNEKGFLRGEILKIISEMKNNGQL